MSFSFENNNNIKSEEHKMTESIENWIDRRKKEKLVSYIELSFKCFIIKREKRQERGKTGQSSVNKVLTQ